MCTRFFALAPCGVGTGLHESLPSYLDRLAQLHGVPNGLFFRHEVHPEAHHSPTHPGSSLHGHSRRMLVGNGYAQRIASFVALATGVPEVAGLVHPILSMRLSWYKNTRRKATWCPYCFSEWARKGLPIYRPLLWSFASVRCCPIHNIPLQERCPNCSREFDHFDTSSWSLNCLDCQHSLARASKPADSTGSKVDLICDRFCAAHVSDLLGWGSRCSISDVSSDRFPTNIRNAISQSGSEYSLASMTGLSRPVIQKWRHGRGRPLLPALLRLSYCFDIPLYHWFSESIPSSLFSRRTAIPKGVSALRIYTSSPVRNSIRQAVVAQLAARRNEPQSVSELAKLIGTNSRRLYDVCPKLIRAFVARRARIVSKKKEQRAKERVRRVRQAIAVVHSSGRHPSRNAVLALLHSQGVRCSWLLKEIFRKETTTIVNNYKDDKTEC